MVQNPVTITGLVIFAGFTFGEIARRLGLPRITGYILAGIILNPDLLGLIPGSFPAHTELITDISLSFITFSVGATLLLPVLRRLGKGMALITLFEAEFANFFVAAGFMILLPLLVPLPAGATWISMVVPAALLFGALGSPTDPSATLAVAHQYKADGDVTRTVMGVSAMDDVYGMVNYSVAVAIGSVCILGNAFSISSSLLKPLMTILLSLAIGAFSGFVFHLVSKMVRGEGIGTFLVLLLGMLCLCFGAAKVLDADPLLSTMCMGAVVVNLGAAGRKVLSRVEGSVEQLIFVLFFTLSGMHLDFSVLPTAAPLILLFVLLRAAGKFAGVGLGAHIAHASSKVKKYTAPCLIPQGGIVIGLALMLKQHSEFDGISDLVISVILGTVVIHELVGPILARTSLGKAGELGTGE